MRVVLGVKSLTVDMGAYEYGPWPFQIAEVVEKDGQAELTWKSRPGDTYIIWSASDLTSKSPWTTMEGTVPSGGETTTWADPDTTSTRKFYRIEIVDGVQFDTRLQASLGTQGG